MDEAKALATALSTIGKFTVKAKVGEDKRIFGRHVCPTAVLTPSHGSG
jgi:ribosomal protein L9